MIKRDLYYERISTKSLRDDVRYLGNILGRVILDQEGKNFFNLVEKTRLLSKANIANRNNKEPAHSIITAISSVVIKFKWCILSVANKPSTKSIMDARIKDLITLQAKHGPLDTFFCFILNIFKKQ